MSEEIQDHEEQQEGSENLLIPMDDYLVSGVHIGTTIATKSMNRFVYRVRDDGLNVLDVHATDERLRTAAKFLARYPGEEVAIFSARQYGMVPAAKMARLCGFKVAPGRFIPGTLTNPDYKGYMEPRIVLLTDPRSDKQALAEAGHVGTTVVAFCDSDNVTTGVDFVVPVNNKGRKALARIYHLLAQQVLRERQEIGEEDEISETVDDFAFKLIRE